MDFLFSTLDNDLDMGENNSKGLQFTKDRAVEAEQRVSQYLGLNQAEWFLDITKGIPYIRNSTENLSENIRYLLGDKNPNTPQFIKATLDKQILDLDFVTSLESSYVFDNKERVYTYTYKITIDDGTEISIASNPQTITFNL